MVVVAVAGGSDGIGKVITNAIKSDGVHECLTLSRKPVSGDDSIVALDYDDIDSMKATLESHNIHTIVSGISMWGDAGGQSQMNLIEAADRSTCTKRFIPSEFGPKYTEE